jgi:hypothetical protein
VRYAYGLPRQPDVPERPRPPTTNAVARDAECRSLSQMAYRTSTAERHTCTVTLSICTTETRRGLVMKHLGILVAIAIGFAAASSTITASSAPTWNPNDFIGSWKCSFTTGHGGSGVLYTSTKSLGVTHTTAVVNGYTSTEIDDWTYKSTGPTTYVLSMTSPTRAAQLQANAQEIHRPIPPAAPYIMHVTWISHNHLREIGSDGVHSASYDCHRR